MSLIKKMQIGDNRAGRYTKEYLLTDFKCRTHRLHDEYRPHADKYCDYIEATVIAPGREDMLMYEWFINRLTLSGRLLIQLPPKPNQRPKPKPRKQLQKSLRLNNIFDRIAKKGINKAMPFFYPFFLKKYVYFVSFFLQKTKKKCTFAGYYFNTQSMCYLRVTY